MSCQHLFGSGVGGMHPPLCPRLKLAIFVTGAKTGYFGLFPHYKEFLATTDSEMSFPSVKQDLVQYLTNLQANFKERFLELVEV